jgi:hypothetical protein
MKQQSFIKNKIAVLISAPLFIVTVLSFFLLSFTANKMADDFLKQLGIGKTEADKKITDGLMYGYINAYGIKNLKKIVVGDRAGVVNDVLVYCKKHTASTAFISQYNALRNQNKPKMKTLQTPEENRKQDIANAEEGVANMEKVIKTATPEMKKVFEPVLAEQLKQLKAAKDSKNKSQASYEKNYPVLLKQFQDSYNLELKEWEQKYPANQMLYLKKQLLFFMEETKDIDFSAAVTEKNGKKIFVNPTYERKSKNWKMAFRVGKEGVEAARVFVQKWITEIN